MDTSHRFYGQKNIPAVMGFALTALALIVVTQFLLGIAFLTGVAKGPPWLVVGAIVSAMLWVGLFQRHKWAYLVTMVICPLNVLLALDARGGFLISVILNGLVWVPVLMSSSWFWQSDSRGFLVRNP